MENDIFRNQIIDNTLIIDDSVPYEITKIQINECIISLSSDQRHVLREADCDKGPKVIYKKHMTGIPNDLFQILVKKYLPLHVQITHAFLKISLILVLIYLTISMVDRKPYSQTEGISEMMHVIFIIVVGSLPRVLEVALDNSNHHIRKEIKLRKIRATINKYWINQ
jgi:hypothetical protein